MQFPTRDEDFKRRLLKGVLHKLLTSSKYFGPHKNYIFIGGAKLVERHRARDEGGEKKDRRDKDKDKKERREGDKYR